MGNQSRPVSSLIHEASRLVSRIVESSKHGECSITLWRDYSNAVVNIASFMDIKDIVKVLDAYSFMRYRHVKLLDTLATRVFELLYKMNGTDIVSVLRSYAILEHRNDFMFRLMLPEVSKLLELLSLTDLSSIFYSYSRLGYYNHHLTSCVEAAIVENIQHVRPKELSYVLNGLGKLRVRWNKLETVLGCRFCSIVDLCSHTDLGLIVNALGRLDFCGQPHLFSVVETEIYRKAVELNSQSISLVANAISRHSDAGKPLEFIGRHVKKRLKEFDIHSLCLLSAAFSRRGNVREDLFDSMAERVGSLSVQLYPRAVASLTFSYARTKHLYGPLMLFSGKHLERFMDFYTCNEAAMVLRAHNLLNIRNEDMLLALASNICKCYPDMVLVRGDDTVPEERLSYAIGVQFNDVSDNEFISQDQHVQPNERKASDTTNDPDMTHINHLVIIPTDIFCNQARSKNFLQSGLLHSLLWIIQSYAMHGVWNEGDVKGALQRVANEVACRQHELTPLVTCHLLYALSKLNYRFDALLELLLLEIRDPRINSVFEQDYLRVAYSAMLSFGIDPESNGIYRIGTTELKSLMERCRNDTMKVVKCITHKDRQRDTANILKITVPFADDSYEPTHLSDSQVTYVHIPVCVATSVNAGRPAKDFADMLKYNFAI
ncbi:uncharacterized protein BBOV_IV009680 [Babesia bovis T2Bo]|uniref:RNA-editing substrate-binding complex 6 protein domain-containing protein n=1 Tax=Babesia bovis TaxID=5865 RepID=A7AS03_BABBO|nr:uncharacterized protein BBOV_IV009680 [Babesia bovis T2Bo]EDO07322.1 hypothetical protein BBOV_IV009680 [Babesia bovis T2Bo]|eukprot:XP_001610890.1 hypothetical protein [Babesia bovis T2Bo]